MVIADAGYRGVEKREEAKDIDVTWHIPMRPGQRRQLDPKKRRDLLLEKAGKLKASVRAKVEHPFRVVKQQLGYAKVAVSRLGQEHGAAEDAVRAEQSVDGAKAIDGSAGMSAPAAPETGARRIEMRRVGGEFGLKSRTDAAMRDAGDGSHRAGSCRRGCADLP